VKPIFRNIAAVTNTAVDCSMYIVTLCSAAWSVSVLQCNQTDKRTDNGIV